jgi:glycosyltransferase involved in cell wall biosynthesis
MGRMVAHLAARLAADGEWAVEIIDTYGRHVNEAHAWLAMPFHFAASVARLVAHCLAGRVALAHVHMAAFGSAYRKSILLLLCRLFAVPVVLHVHGGNFDRFYARLGASRRRLLRWILGGAAEIIVLGEYWRQFFAAELAIPRERVSVLYNGVPRPTPAEARRERHGCEILFLGMIWPEKGIRELLEALASPSLSRLPWHLSLAGIGRIEEYRRASERLGIGDRVTFRGWTDERATEALLAGSDILALPSHFECLPMAILEAMAHGIAVVATPVGAVPEAIIDGESGLLVPVGSSEQLGWALERLIANPALRRRLGAAALTRFRQFFDLDIFEERIREIYRRHAPAG